MCSSDLLEHGDAPEQILGSISSQFRTIWAVKYYQEQGLSKNQIAKEMGAKLYPVELALKLTKKIQYPATPELLFRIG